MTWLSWRIKVQHCMSLYRCKIRYGTNTLPAGQGEGRGRQGVMGDGGGRGWSPRQDATATKNSGLPSLLMYTGLM